MDVNNTITRVFHSPGQELDETLKDRMVLENYNFMFPDLYIEKDDINNFLNDVKKKFKLKTKTYKFGAYTHIYYFNKEIFIDGLIYKTFSMDVYFKNFEIADEFYKLYYDKYFKNDVESKITLIEYFLTSKGIGESTKILNYEHFKFINEKYYPYIDVNKFMEEFVFGDENILILCGEPGTGKSKFASLIMKKLLEDTNYMTAFDEEFDGDNDIYYRVATAKNIDMVAMDQFWLNVKNSDLIILDDLDFLLSSRKENREDTIKNQFLSNLLSFTDGIEKNNTKIIITTNQPFETIDEALLRKGRLFSILEFRPLKYKEALDLWKSEGLTKKEFDKLFGDADMIKHCDIGEAINNIKRNKKYVSKKEFIKDPSINALSKANSRRVGLI